MSPKCTFLEKNKVALKRLSSEELPRINIMECKFTSDQQIKDPLFSNSHNLI